MLTETELHKVDFIENDFPTIEVKKSLELYELQEEATQYLSEGRELQAHLEITKDNGSAYLLVHGNVSLDGLHKVLSYKEANMVKFPNVMLRLKGKPTCIHS